jgi:cell division transport system ATP-binding protein
MKIVFEQVSKNYGVINALSDINFTVDKGDFILLVGPSGAGKSTILKLILNQIKPTSGHVIIDDLNITHAKKKEIEKIRKNIGIIFQDYQLIADKTIEENIHLALDIISYPKEKMYQKTDEVLEKVGLTSRRFLFPSQVSTGELQRAALARALSIQPSLILADEPTGNVDAENTWNLIKLLQKINKEGTTIIMTTHDPDIIESLGKEVIYLKNGSIVKNSK